MQPSGAEPEGSVIAAPFHEQEGWRLVKAEQPAVLPSAARPGHGTPDPPAPFPNWLHPCMVDCSMRTGAILVALVGVSCLCAFLLLTEYHFLPALPMSLFSSVKHAMKHQPRLIVVGSGLGGTSAALAAAQGDPGLEVVVLEKEAKPGGNSLKASSGINALTPEAGDSADAFREDTTRSGGGLSRPELVSTLVVRPALAAQLRDLGGRARLRLGERKAEGG